MVLTVAVVTGFVIVAVVVGAIMRRGHGEPPTRDAFPVPRQLDRVDFPRSDAPWLVALFSSATCAACDEMRGKVEVLASAEVSVCDVEFPDARDVHERYDVQGVPMVVIADSEGVVHAGFVGPTTATDLWAALAELRRPGSTPEADLGRL